MDLHTVRVLHRPVRRGELDALLGPGAAALGGGTWLFSEPQPGLAALVDLTGLGWPALTREPDGALTISATCTLAELAAAGPALFGRCCRALAGSFKIWHTATVGGNICLALPAGPMTSLCAALDGEALLWGPGGAQRRVPVARFVTGVRTTDLRPGEVLRSVRLPAAASSARTAFGRAALTAQGRSGSVVIGRRDPDGGLVLTVTAATERPFRFTFPAPPTGAALRAALAGVDRWYADPHGAPDWRAHVTGRLAAEVVDELA
ncbi:FAD binding domain-containing protein [Pseudonocardia humida]|uniref:FAD binding domain-containing protein n=1 Tax=Pseudonocardia humida TaxID=2800819 RepID=A0ABT1ABK0_9PSEU|nr:FAD binding domain-containing protein [Pseudonocardia humida]MCO1660417.1 FAD binding domain-containing protein [Pseudonocardia humida]